MVFFTVHTRLSPTAIAAVPTPHGRGTLLAQSWLFVIYR